MNDRDRRDWRPNDYPIYHPNRWYEPRFGFGCGPVGCALMLSFASTIVAGVLVVMAAVSLPGCSPKPDPDAQARQDLAEEASAAAIDARTSDPPEDLPVVHPVGPCCKQLDNGRCEAGECHCGDNCLCFLVPVTNAAGEAIGTKKCCDECRCDKEPSPVHRALTWFYCPDCRMWSRWNAKDSQTLTQCKKCELFKAYRVTDEEAAKWDRAYKAMHQRGEQKRIFRGAMNYPGAAMACKT
ncbi:MAG: hypothetical protein KGL39_32465 [Patescibacteria group bacterium]|nr:hypothetical protein [Patescibacteria group bacterium]